MIGTDLGGKFVKICKILNLEKKTNEYSIISAVIDISKSTEIERADKLSAVLKKMACLNDSAYLAVGGKDIINRDLTLKRNNAISLKEQINNEALNSIPEDLGKMYTSFAIMKNDSDK